MNRLLALGAVAALVLGCGKDADDTASDAASAVTGRTQRKLAPGASAFGTSTKVAGGKAQAGGPPTSAPPEMTAGQGMSSVTGKVRPKKKLSVDEDLPE